MNMATPAIHHRTSRKHTHHFLRCGCAPLKKKRNTPTGRLGRALEKAPRHCQFSECQKHSCASQAERRGVRNDGAKKKNRTRPPAKMNAEDVVARTAMGATPCGGVGRRNS